MTRSAAGVDSLTIASLVKQYREGTTNPVEVLEQEFARIERVNEITNSVPFVAQEAARQASEDSASRWRQGQPVGPLDGVPVTIKDSFRAAGTPWRHGTLANASRPFDTEDSSPVRALRAAGAVIIGKTAMPDMGMMAAGVSSLYGIVRNPWDPSTNTSGSSAGAGASLAAGVAFAGLGSDIAGSVRLPAASNGLVGFKPTQGLIPYLAPSTTRSPGPLARCVDDAWTMLDAVVSPDPRDNFSLPSLPGAGDHRTTSARHLTIGVLTELGYGSRCEAPVIDAVRSAAQVLRSGGSETIEMDPLFDHDPYDPLDRVFQVRAAVELESYGPEAKKVIPVLQEWAKPARGYSASDFSRYLATVDTEQQHVTMTTAAYDFVISPVLPVVSFPAESTGLESDRPLAHCGFTAWYNQSGQPAVSLCFGMHNGCPIGVQIVGQRFDDYRLLGLAKWLEAHRPFSVQYPVPQMEKEKS